MKTIVLILVSAWALLAEEHHDRPDTIHTPEPATWVMMATGLAVVIAVARRRK